MKTWPCEAYGSDGAEVGAVCFVGDLWQRVCGTESECHRMLVAERQRVFRRINELAAHDVADFVYLAQEVTHPEQLLGGSE